MPILLREGEWKLQYQSNDNSSRGSLAGVPAAGLVREGGGGVLLRAGQAGGVW